MTQQESGVSPRSSGGAPDERPEPDYWNIVDGSIVVATYRNEESASREAARRNGNIGRDVYRIESCYTGQSYEALRTQVSALRQPLADEKLLGLIEAFSSATDLAGYFRGTGSHHLDQVWADRDRARDALTGAVSALRQEAAALTEEREKLRDSIAISADTNMLLGQSMTAVHEKLAAARQEAETLRGQLEAEKSRLDWLDEQRSVSAAHWGGGYGLGAWADPSVQWTVGYEVKCGTYKMPPELAATSVREAIDAARVAAPREPTND